MRKLAQRTPSPDPLALLRDYVRVQVRAGFLGGDALRADLVRVAAEDVGGDDPRPLVDEMLASVVAELRTEQRTWPEVTDHDRLHGALDRLRDEGIAVLEGVDDHWSAAAELERLDDAGGAPTGIVWFTLPDVWHAVEHGMLEVNLWHGDSANVAPGDVLLERAVGAFVEEGLPAHFDEGRIEVTMAWQRRL